MRAHVMSLTAAATIFASAFAGCSGESTAEFLQVQGVVTFDGKPAGLSLVTFWPTAGGSESSGVYRSTTDDAGVYKIGKPATDKAKADGLPAGEYKVTLSRTVDRSGRAVIEGGKATEPVTAKQVFPASYQDKETTPLSIKVSPAETKFDFDVKKS